MDNNIVMKMSGMLGTAETAAAPGRLLSDRPDLLPGPEHDQVRPAPSVGLLQQLQTHLGPVQSLTWQIASCYILCTCSEYSERPQPERSSLSSLAENSGSCCSASAATNIRTDSSAS